MTANCLSCQHGALRDAIDRDRTALMRPMVKAGFVNCLRSPFRSSYFAATHTCESWAAAADGVVAKRIAWLNKTTGGQS